MDPFNDLPPDVQLRILLSISSARSLYSIIRASLTMRQQYQSKRPQIDQNLSRLQKEETRRLRESNASIIRQRNALLLQTINENPDFVVPVFEDPAVLRAEARRLVKESTTCDLATVSKYVLWMPRGAHIVCSQSHRTAKIPAKFELYEGKTEAEIELAIGFHLEVLKKNGRLDPEEAIELRFRFS